MRRRRRGVGGLMADRRMLSRTISHNEQLASVPLAAALLFTWCLPHLDRDGRMSGNPALVKSVAVPLRPEITVENIPGLLAALRAADLVRWYEVDGKRVLWFPGFNTHQTGMKYDREKVSGLPPYNPDTCVDCPEGSVRIESSQGPEVFGPIGSLSISLNSRERERVLVDGQATHAREAEPDVENSHADVDNSAEPNLPPAHGADDAEQRETPGGDDRDGRERLPAMGGVALAGSGPSGNGVAAEPGPVPERPARPCLEAESADERGSGEHPPVVRTAAAGLSDDAALAHLARDFHERQDRIRAAKGGGLAPLAVQPVIRPVPVPGADGEPIPERITPDQVVALWASRQPFPPDVQSMQRQAGAAAWLAKQPAEHVVRAMVGIALVWPHKPPKSEPWTCEDVRHKWDKALQASEQHPALVDARTAQAITNRMNGGGHG